MNKAMNYGEALEHGAQARKSAGKKPQLRNLQMEEAENGGHVIEHHFESNGGPYKEPETHVFAKPEGAKPKLPKGHVLAHIAEHMNIPHEVSGSEPAEAEDNEE